MSLLSTASPWSDSNNISKKRLPSIRKTRKNLPLLPKIEDDEEPSSTQALDDSEDSTFGDLEKTQEDKQLKINNLISNMNKLNQENEGSGLSDFQPLEYPLLQQLGSSQKAKDADEEIPSLTNELQSPPPRIQQTVGEFASNNYDHSERQYKQNPYSNYRRVYEAPKIAVPQDYYNKMGLGTQPTLDNKLLEKINYMIHMLEQQQNEKTSNLTEEFVLYVFLGIFIIFIVDAFTRTSVKYVR